MILAICGPTASSKSELADNLAKFYNAEVINFDAYQVYIEMEKGTAKPSKDFLDAHPNYHMFNIGHIDEKYDVYQFQQEGRKLLEKYKDKNVILVGGTGLYLKALLFDYKFLEEGQMPEGYKADITNKELYQTLLVLDREDALKIGSNNRKRLLRALYVYETHGKTKTDLNENGKDHLLYDDVVFIGLNPEREYLYDKINKRVDKMVENGLVEEAQELKEKFPNVNQALAAIGYKEFFKGLDIQQSIELIKINTRKYAKRQITFFTHQFQNVHWFTNIDEAFEYVTTNYR